MNRLHAVASAPHARTIAPVRTERDRTSCRPRDGGFTLVELTLVVAVVGILVSVATPPIMRARASSLEASTIASFQALNTAQASFALTCGGGAFAPAVVWLTTPPAGSENAFIGPGIAADMVNRHGYGIRFTAGTAVSTAAKSCNGLPAGAAVQSYFIEAYPLQSDNGLTMRYFGTSSDGIIYQSTSRVRAYYSGVPAPPATPIQ